MPLYGLENAFIFVLFELKNGIGCAGFHVFDNFDGVIVVSFDVLT